MGAVSRAAKYSRERGGAIAEITCQARKHQADWAASWNKKATCVTAGSASLKTSRREWSAAAGVLCNM